MQLWNSDTANKKTKTKTGNSPGIESDKDADVLSRKTMCIPWVAYKKEAWSRALCKPQAGGLAMRIFVDGMLEVNVSTCTM